MAWVVVCPSGDVRQGAIKRQRLENGDAVALTRLADDRIVAFHNACPHFGGPLGVGKLHENSVICPWHFFRFNLLTGKAEGADASIMQLKLYSVEENNSAVLIEV